MSDIFNCDRTKQEESIRFGYQCPKHWNILELTSQQSVRFCQVCQENVYYCINKEQAKQHAKQGHCIVIDVKLGNTKQQIRGRVALTKKLPTND